MPIKVPTRLLKRETDSGVGQETAKASHSSTPTETPEDESMDSESKFTKVRAKIVDVPGHFNFQKTVMVESSGAKAIILLLDSKDKGKFGRAATILYDLLSDIDLISE